eukprot:3903935-Prymnesium_polylepis.1
MATKSGPCGRCVGLARGETERQSSAECGITTPRFARSWSPYSVRPKPRVTSRSNNESTNLFRFKHAETRPYWATRSNLPIPKSIPKHRHKHQSVSQQSTVATPQTSTIHSPRGVTSRVTSPTGSVA